MAIVDASYTNLVPAFGGGYSYAFDGQWGSLDHALANASLRSQVTSARDWFINADEPTVLDYNPTSEPGPGSQPLRPGPIPHVGPQSAGRRSRPDFAPRHLGVSQRCGSWCWEHPGGAAAGDPGSTASFVVNVKFKKNATAPDGHATLIFHRTESDGVLHTYQVKATISTFLRSVATGEALLTATATITDITAPETRSWCTPTRHCGPRWTITGILASSPIPSE